jgi:hypothetical protein
VRLYIVALLRTCRIAVTKVLTTKEGLAPGRMPQTNSKCSNQADMLSIHPPAASASSLLCCICQQSLPTTSKLLLGIANLLQGIQKHHKLQHIQRFILNAWVAHSISTELIECTLTARSKRFFGSGCPLPKLLKWPANAFSVV